MASVLGLSWRWCCLCDAALGWRGFPSTLNIRCDTSPFGKRSLGLIIQSVAILNRVNILCFCTQWDIVTHWRMDTKMIVNTVNFKKLEAYESRSSHSSSCRTDDNQLRRVFIVFLFCDCIAEMVPPSPLLSSSILTLPEHLRMHAE